MARYRLSNPAKADIASMLRVSETMHGTEARIRYRALLEHDPEKWLPVFRERSCSNNKIERDDDSKKSHHALTSAMRRIAAEPQGLSTVDRGDVFAGIRSFHIRHSGGESAEAPVGDPVHVIFYRAIGPGLIEIVRVLHERMEPSRHIGE